MEPYLNAAHLSHDPRDNVRVAVLCPACHSRHDTPQRIAMTRRTRARRSGQLWLLPEIEFARGERVSRTFATSWPCEKGFCKTAPVMSWSRRHSSASPEIRRTLACGDRQQTDGAVLE